MAYEPEADGRWRLTVEDALRLAAAIVDPEASNVVLPSTGDTLGESLSVRTAAGLRCQTCLPCARVVGEQTRGVDGAGTSAHVDSAQRS